MGWIRTDRMCRCTGRLRVGSGCTGSMLGGLFSSASVIIVNWCVIYYYWRYDMCGSEFLFKIVNHKYYIMV